MFNPFATIAINRKPELVEDKDYDQFESLIKQRIANNKEPLFTADVDPQLLWSLYINSLPYNRQYYNCNCCRRFIQQYGGLVTIDPKSGRTQSLLWKSNDSEVPEFFRTATQQLWAAVKLATVTGMFISNEETWGNPVTGKWTHLCGVNNNVYKSLVTTDKQAMAEKKEEYKMFTAALSKLQITTVKKAVDIVAQGGLYRTEKAEEMVKWLYDTVMQIKSYCHDEQSRIIWHRVATAPTGYCHISNTVLGTLLEDIEAGYDLDTIKSRWAKKLNPLQYQRPQAAPTVGNVQRAEKLFVDLGLEKSLNRHYAGLSELPDEHLLWKPRAAAPKYPTVGNLFGHLKTKDTFAPKQRFPQKTMSWTVFVRDVLPRVVEMELKVPSHGGYYGLVTTSDYSAPPIIQWDHPNIRNPFSWYFYYNGSSNLHWNVKGLTKVVAVFNSPDSWNGNVSREKNVFFALENCRDVSRSNPGPGLALFPGILKSELREVRATIEAYSKTRQLAQVSEQQANGIANFPQTLEVTTDAGVQTIVVDRYE